MISLGSLGGAGGAQSGSGPRMTMRQVNHNSHVRPLQRRVIGHNCTTLRRCRSRTRHNLFLRCALRALEYLPVHALVECCGCDHIDRFGGVGGVASWPNQAFQNRNRQVSGLQKSAAKYFQTPAGENSSAPSPNTPIRKTPRARCAASPNRNTPSARFTIGSRVVRKRRCPSPCGSSRISIRTEGSHA